MSASQFFLPYRPVFDGGLLVPGAQIYFTLAGTNTSSEPFADASLATPLSNPVIADGVGAFPPIYLDGSKSYRVRVYSRIAVAGMDTPMEEYDPYIPGAFMQFGYASGSGMGGQVTQDTSKTTTVELDAPSGRIVMSASSIPAGNTYIFNFVNSYISAADVVVVRLAFLPSALFNYSVEAGEINDGGCRIALTNRSGGPLAEAVPLNFVVIKGAID